MSTISKNTRERILDAAQDLIQRRGLNAMSFKDLSDLVGIRKASVHHHFASKAEMVHALLDRYQSDFDELVSQILHSKVRGKTKLKRYFDIFLETGKGDKSCLCGMLAAEVWSLESEGVEIVKKFLSGNVVAIRQMIREGMDDGSISSHCEASGSAEIVLAALEGALMLSRCSGGSEKLADMLSRLLAMLSAN